MEEKSNSLMEPRPRKAITLVCLFCSGRTTIHVSLERGMPETLLWECLECQKAEISIPAGKGAPKRNHKRRS